MSDRPCLSPTPRNPSAQMRSRRFCCIYSSLQSSWTWRWIGLFSAGQQRTSLPASVTNLSDSDLQGKRGQTVRTQNSNKEKIKIKIHINVCKCVSEAIYLPSLQHECVHETMNHPFGVIWITLATQSFSAVLEQNFPDRRVMIYRSVCCRLTLMKYWRLCNNLIWNVT